MRLGGQGTGILAMDSPMQRHATAWESDMSAQSENNDTYVRKILNDVFRSDDGVSHGVEIQDDTLVFCNNPSQYVWTCVGRRDVLVPHRESSGCSDTPPDADRAEAPTGPSLRWQLQNMWVIDGVLCRGESNLMQRRRFYIDPDSWAIVMGEGHGHSGKILAFFQADLDAHATRPIAGKWEWL